MFSAFIVDNRVLGTGSFISEVAASTIQACTMSLLGRYIVLSEKHEWLPPCSISYAAGADSVQQIKPPADVSVIPRLAAMLEPKHTCYGAVSSHTSWNYLCAGLESFLQNLSSQPRRSKPHTTQEKPLNFMLCLVTSDKALVQSAQDHNLAVVTGQGDASFKERMLFRKLCSQISTTIADIYGPRAYAEIRIACAMVTRLPAGDVNVISFNNQTHAQPDIENEINKGK